MFLNYYSNLSHSDVAWAHCFLWHLEMCLKGWAPTFNNWTFTHVGKYLIHPDGVPFFPTSLSPNYFNSLVPWIFMVHSWSQVREVSSLKEPDPDNSVFAGGGNWKIKEWLLLEFPMPWISSSSCPHPHSDNILGGPRCPVFPKLVEGSLLYRVIKKDYYGLIS